MPVLELEFEVFCAKCGAGLCNNSTEGSNGHSQYIKVDPCEQCLEDAKQDSLEEGYDNGYEECQQEKED